MAKKTKSTFKHLRGKEIPPVPTPEEIEAELKGKGMEELAKTMYKLEKQIELLQAKMAPLVAVYEHIRLRAIPTEAENTGVTSVTIQFTKDYKGAIRLTPDMYVQMLDKEKGYEWLRDNGHGDLIVETVNGGSLKAAFTERIKKAEGTPPSEIFKLTPFKRASISKA